MRIYSSALAAPMARTMLLLTTMQVQATTAYDGCARYCGSFVVFLDSGSKVLKSKTF